MVMDTGSVLMHQVEREPESAPRLLQRVLRRLCWFFTSGTRLIAIVVFLVGLPGVVTGTWAEGFPPSLVNFHTSISAELVGMALAVLLIDTANELRSERERKEELILQMGSPDNAFAVEAVRVLRLKGWLMDGSLQDATLNSAQLQRASLDAANLNGADLLLANLNGARLVDTQLRGATLNLAELKGAYCLVTNFHGASLYESKLEETQFYKADLQGADLTGASLSGAQGCTLKQLGQAKSLQGATMPDGVTLSYADNWRESFEVWCERTQVDAAGSVVPVGFVLTKWGFILRADSNGINEPGDD